MTIHHVKVATLKFYDMADRYILTFGEQHFDLSDQIAQKLISELTTDEHATIATEHNHVAVTIQTK